MYYCIYCYINKINSHKYVGQTNNLRRRNNEHFSGAFNPKSVVYDDLFHKKIREYGFENFILTILEERDLSSFEEIDEREIYWVDKLESFRGTGKGYNSTLGGQKNKKCISGILNQQQLKELKEEIKKGINYETLSKKYNISSSFISNINMGYYFRDICEQYPLYKYYKSDYEYNELIELLLNSDLSFKQIANKLNIGESTVKKINYGTLRKGLYSSYPIRKISSQKKKANQIKELLMLNKYSYEEISKIVGVSVETVERNNLGITNKDNNLNYPISSILY